ncbi:MAG TPA: low molecular weight protein arginine phosphatase [Firmicutes bacterium]|nr:low molecular weight protein arginine phosphatase [Bacillota bacterium]HWR56055.1 low molecular weight protein arginine phosphatase [Negativicutes bacterium]
MLRVLFVCTGNTCRSPMAEALFRQLIQGEKREQDILTISAGLSVWGDAPASGPAMAVMRKQGVDLSSHRSRSLTPELIEAADLILTMTGDHKRTLLAAVPGAQRKVFTLAEFAGEGFADVADPYGAAEAVYQQCADEISRHLTKSWEKILKFHQDNAGENTSA